MAELAPGPSFTFTFVEVLTDGYLALHQRQLIGHDADAKRGRLLQPHRQLAGLFVVLCPGAVDEPAVGTLTPRVLKIMAECILMAPAELPRLIRFWVPELTALAALTHITQEVTEDVATCGPGSKGYIAIELDATVHPTKDGGTIVAGLAHV